WQSFASAGASRPVTGRSPGATRTTDGFSASARPRGYSPRLFIVDCRDIAGTGSLPVRAQRIEVEFVIGPLTRAAVNKGVPPGIFRQFVALQIGAGPAADARPRRGQRLQPLLRGRVSPNIELEHVEDGGEALDRLMRDLFLGRAELPQRRGRHEADQKTEDGEHDKQLQQCETALPPVATTGARQLSEGIDPPCARGPSEGEIRHQTRRSGMVLATHWKDTARLINDMRLSTKARG